MWKRKDFFPSGSTETAPIYMVMPIIFAGKCVNDRSLTIIKNGICHNFVGRAGLIRSKNQWLRIKSAKTVKKEFDSWRANWKRHDRELFDLATDKNQDWKSGWKKLDSFQASLWEGAYKIEALDNFADEINGIIYGELRKRNIPVKYKFDLVSSESPNRFQEMLADRNRAKRGLLSREKYAEKYWFSHGNWNGGVFLNRKILEKDIREKISLPNFEKIKRIHKKYDKRLDRKTRTLIEIIRILSHWREERKVVVQKIMLGYVNVSKIAARELGVSPAIIRSAVLTETKNLEKYVKRIRRRLKSSVFLVEKGKWRVKIFEGIEAKPYMKEFFAKTRDKIIKGTIASKGSVAGKARIILKKRDFHKFKKGEILVTTMTRPEFYPIMKKAAAIVTEEGGLTSHAAIAARELGVPCIIGTKIATSAVKNGDFLEVDADKGFIRIIE